MTNLGRDVTSVDLVGDKPRQSLLDNVQELVSAQGVEVAGQVAGAGARARASAGARASGGSGSSS